MGGKGPRQVHILATRTVNGSNFVLQYGSFFERVLEVGKVHGSFSLGVCDGDSDVVSALQHRPLHSVYEDMGLLDLLLGCLYDQ